MPRFADDLGVAGLAIHQQHLDLAVLSLGKEDIAAHRVVPAYFLGFECERIDLLIGLQVCFILAFTGAGKSSPKASERGADQRTRARRSKAEVPCVTGSARDCSCSGSKGRASDTADGTALHR